MKKLTFIALVALAFSFTTKGHASEDAKCDAPKNEWVSQDAASQKLEAEGWKVRKVKEEDGCYEAYAMKDGKRAEIFLNPKTLEVVRIKEGD
jgi:hypothetical protein